MEQLKEIEDTQIVQNTENRRKTRRNPSQIRKLFDKVYMKYIDQSVRINDVKFKYDQFEEYVKVVSNYEIALIHGGDNSKLKKYLKELWKKLSDEHKLIELTIIQLEQEKKKQDKQKEKEKTNDEEVTQKEKSLDELTSSKSLKEPFKRTISRLYELTSSNFNL